VAASTMDAVAHFADTKVPHAMEREEAILRLVWERGHMTFRELADELPASRTTLRRDLNRLAAAGRIARAHGQVLRVEDDHASALLLRAIRGRPLHENSRHHSLEKQMIGRAAAALCSSQEAIMIAGGSTTLEMCPYLVGLNLLVLTNSLHILSALCAQSGTRVLVSGGTVFREQNIVFSANDPELMPRAHTPKLFMGAAAVGACGVMQRDDVLAGAERRLIDRAQHLILLVDSSKFHNPCGSVVCGLDEVDVVVTDSDIEHSHRQMLAAHGVTVITAPRQP